MRTLLTHDLGTCRDLGDGLSVHGVAAVFCGLEGHVGSRTSHQLHIGHRDLGFCTGVAGFDVDRDFFVSAYLIRKGTGLSVTLSVHFNRAVILHNGIVKGQRRRCVFVVGDGQRGAIAGSFVAGVFLALRGAGDCRAESRPRIRLATIVAQDDISIG